MYSWAGFWAGFSALFSARYSCLLNQNPGSSGNFENFISSVESDIATFYDCPGESPWCTILAIHILLNKTIKIFATTLNKIWRPVSPADYKEERGKEGSVFYTSEVKIPDLLNQGPGSGPRTWFPTRGKHTPGKPLGFPHRHVYNLDVREPSDSHPHPLSWLSDSDACARTRTVVWARAPDLHFQRRPPSPTILPPPRPQNSRPNCEIRQFPIPIGGNSNTVRKTAQLTKGLKNHSPVAALHRPSEE